MQCPLRASGRVAAGSVARRVGKLFELRARNVFGEITQSGLIEGAGMAVEETAITSEEEEGRSSHGAEPPGEIGSGRRTPQRVDDRCRARQIEADRPKATFDPLFRLQVGVDGLLHFQAAGAIREGEDDRQLLSFGVRCLRLSLQIVNASREKRCLGPAADQQEHQAGSDAQPWPK